MKSPEWRSVLRWSIVVPVFLVSFYTTFILMMMVLWIDWPLTSFFSRIGVPPHIAVEFAHLVTAPLAASFCGMATAFAVGFALRLRIKDRLVWGLTASILLTSCYVWLVGRDSPFVSRTCAVVGLAIAITGAIIATIRPTQRLHLVTIFAAWLILTIPVWADWSASPKQPPAARLVWSVVLQRGTWQGMNTGSDYAATRQLLFAGNRVIAVFDSGFAGYEDKWPLSQYKLLSLDRRTGEIKNTTSIQGRWGGMPYIYATEDGHVDVQGANPLTLNPDLSPAKNASTTPKDEAKLSDNTRWNGNYAEDEGFITASDATGNHLLYHGKCASRPQRLSGHGILVFGCLTITLIDTAGKQIRTEPTPCCYAKFAGASKDGTRFAIDFSDSEGDPAYPLYERLILYDSASLKPLARVDIKDLPERQSWSAFSPDGHYFAAGNPNLLSLYEIP